uniref:FBD domain-containing protein n=1 Tax=Aegilops tauschii TaxID=37682 RepID=M8CFA6_AEGTA
MVLETTVCREELDDSRNIGIQFDMPSLCSFRYRGFPFKLSLRSPAPGLARVYLDTNHSERGVYKCEPTARALANFSSTRALKLQLKKIENILSHNASSSYRFQNSTGNQDADEEIILPTFPNLKLLEIDAEFNYRDNNTALALATLLRSCPAMSELRLRLNMTWDYDYDRKTEQQAAGYPFAQSVERFNRLGSMCAEHREDVELGGVSELPDDFTYNSAFSCLTTSLRKVTLQFKSKELNCFQVQLAKFLVENAMILEEMHVEDGDQFWPDHLLDKLTRWRTDAFRRRNLSDTAGFQVFQLANPVADPKVKVHY